MEEVDKVIRNMELIIAIRKVQDDDTPQNRSRMISEMMRSKFITPAVISAETEEEVRRNKAKGLPTSIQASFKVINTTDGRKFLPAFTDTAQMREWKTRCHITEPVRNMVMNFDAYAKYIFGSNGDLAGFVINPFGENMVFPYDLMKSLMSQKMEHEQRVAEQRAQNTRDE